MASFEGGERAGKTTLIRSMERALKKASYSVFVTREPGGSLLGEEVRLLLLQGKQPISSRAELALFLASRAEHVEKILIPALQKEQVVLCDRFSDSSIAYQGGGRKLGMERVEEINAFFCQNLQPEITFYLDIDPKKAFSRSSLEKDRIEEEEFSFHERVRNSFLCLAKKYPSRIFPLDAALPAEVLFEKAWKLLEPKLTCV